MTSFRSIPGPALAAAAVMACHAGGASAANRPEQVYVAATEVAVAAKANRAGTGIADALRAASDDEAHFYDAAQTPVVMRITISKLTFKSAGKAVAAGLPFVGLVAGPNRDALEGEVDVVDRGTGMSLQHFRIQADDDTFFSAGDAALSVGEVGLSLLPFGGLISGAVDVARNAAAKRAVAEKMLTGGFVMLSYRKVFGDKLYKSFARERKALAAAGPTREEARQSLSPAAPAGSSAHGRQPGA